MQLSEKEIEDFVFDDLQNNNGMGLQYRGLELPFTRRAYNQYIKCKWVRQLNIDPYGICDIVGFYRYEGAIHVELLELKAREIKLEDFEQIARYRTGITKYLKNTFSKPCIQFNMVLIGTVGYDPYFLQNLLPISVSELRYDLEGVGLKTHYGYTGWQKTNDPGRSFRVNPKQKLNGEKVY
jgi:hypothetical protein